MAPAALIRAARLRARLSQAELARRSGVPQSVISAYETGRRRPSLHALERLVTASGGRLVLDVSYDPPGELPDTDLARRLRRHRERLLDVAGRYGVTDVRVFGSVARGDSDEHSDVDLLVDVPPATSLFALVALERELSEVLGAPVDVVPTEGLKERVRVAAEREAVRL